MNTFNLGTRMTTSVNRIADIVAGEMGVDSEYEYTGGERGWTGGRAEDVAVDREVVGAWVDA